MTKQQWKCKRCGEMVDMGAFKCGCTESPSPWEPVKAMSPSVTSTYEDDPSEELCSNCGCPIHPCMPCEEVVMLNGNHTDDTYKDLLTLILREGRRKKNRTGVDTIGVFGAQAKYKVDLDAFPILTTKKVWFKGIVHELLWFIRGDTNIKYLVDNDVHIWDEWGCKRWMDSLGAGPKNMSHLLPMYVEGIKNDPEFAEQWGELGEGTYGGMWRGFPYAFEQAETEYGAVKGTETVLKRVDQLQKVIDKLKTNPDDRRMIVSAWHPYWAEKCALSPCHCFMQFNTEELSFDERMNLYKQNGGDLFPIAQCHSEKCFDDMNVPRRRLNLLMLIRSNDMFLGAPFNITSYSLLIAMVAHCVGMEPGTLTYTIGDCHLYVNHLEQVNEQLSRTPKSLPKLWLNPNVKDLFSFKYDDIKLIGYDPHPAIKGDVAV